MVHLGACLIVCDLTVITFPGIVMLNCFVCCAWITGHDFVQFIDALHVLLELLCVIVLSVSHCEIYTGYMFLSYKCLWITSAPLNISYILILMALYNLLLYLILFMLYVLRFKCLSVLSVVRAGGWHCSSSVQWHLDKFQSVSARCVESSAIW